MKKVFITLGVIIFFLYVGRPADAVLVWTPQTSGVVQKLNAVAAVDAQTAWAVGENGTILRTTNGGTTWTAQTSGTVQDLYAVATVDTNTAWAVGNGSTMLKTVDGATWIPQTSGIIGDIWDIVAINATTAIAMGRGGTIIKTLNGGSTWSKVAELSIISTQMGWPAGAWRALATGDGNAIWVVGGGGLILKSTNGGVAWQKQNLAMSSRLQGAIALDATLAWVVGETGTILKTIMNGLQWERQTSGITNELFSVSALDGNVAWTVGAGGTVLKTVDGGTTWTAEASGTTQNLFSVAAVDANTAWAVGAGGTIIKVQETALAPSTVASAFNVSGWAWSENIGWISFNASNTNDPVHYGILIDESGAFSGYAWSPYIDWVSFNDHSADVGKPASYSAPRVQGTNVTGFAKILSFGNGGWLSFKDATYNTTTRQFSGWMWNGNNDGSGIGWVSLNCINTNSCESETSRYAVTRVAPPNAPPNAPTPELPINGVDIGTLDPPMDTGTLRLTWSPFSDPNLGDTQKEYAIELQPISGTLSATLQERCTLASSVLTCRVVSTDSRNFGYSLVYPHLDYDGQTYQWRVQVRDQHDAWSEWSTLASFKTPAHALPTAEFSMAPERPAKGENVQFRDQSDVYGAGNQIKYWQWDFGDGTTTGNTKPFEKQRTKERIVTVDGKEQIEIVVLEDYQKPQHTYSDDGAKTICLTITDQDDYIGKTCREVDIGSGRTLPIWERITPF